MEVCLFICQWETESHKRQVLDLGMVRWRQHRGIDKIHRLCFDSTVRLPYIHMLARQRSVSKLPLAFWLVQTHFFSDKSIIFQMSSLWVFFLPFSNKSSFESNPFFSMSSFCPLFRLDLNSSFKMNPYFSDKLFLTTIFSPLNWAAFLQWIH